ncbi:MAG: GNAT family N-acetyltransferase [Kiritimatiellae bacterium]|nr:GNAT family N-acetyltransferase [Kiritimatiellia bacterium]
MKIRRAIITDAFCLAKIHVDSWRAAYRGLVPDTHLNSLDYNRRTEGFRKRIEAGDAETYLLEQGCKIIGFVTFGIYRENNTKQNNSGEIWGIYLDPDAWRKGYGTILYKEAEKMLKERGHTTIFLWVFAQNTRARRFYEAMGFKTDGGSKTLNFGIPLAVIRYRKELKNAESARRD